MKEIGIYISVSLLIILFFSVIIFFFVKREIKYYKCPQKPISPVLNELFTNNNFSKDENDFEVYLPCGYNDVENELEKIHIPSAKYVFALKGCDKIVSKNNLWIILANTFNRSGASTIMPDSYLLQNVNDYYMASNLISQNKILICKKNIQRKQGLKFAFSQEQLAEARDEDYKVAQEFFSNTLQIKGRKINLRIYYVVMKNGNKIKFFLNTNGKVLYTKEKTNGNISFETHITSYQMDPEIYEKEDLPYSLMDLKEYFGEKKYNVIWEKIVQKMKYISNAISYVFFDDPFINKICFQLFGVDVIINGDEPYILEINKGPDMIPKSIRDLELKQKIYEETFNLVGLVRFVKNNFINIYQSTS